MLITNIFTSSLTNQLKKSSFINRCITGYLLSDVVKGQPGSGVGKGGGGGGAVRESGGSLGQYGAVQEEHYFHKKQREQLDKMKKKKLKKEKTESEQSLEESQKEKDDK